MCLSTQDASLIDVHMLQAIESLPLEQTPEVFGLHANANIQYYTNATKDLWHSLLELQPRTGSGAASVDREAQLAAMATGLVAKIPDPFDLQMIRKSIGAPAPTQVVLLQELHRWNTCARPPPTLTRPSLFAHPSGA